MLSWRRVSLSCVTAARRGESFFQALVEHVARCAAAAKARYFGGALRGRVGCDGESAERGSGRDNLRCTHVASTKVALARKRAALVAPFRFRLFYSVLSAALLPAAAISATHQWCGEISPGKGLAHVQGAGTDRMCGFIQAKYDGPTRFEASVPGTRVYIAKQLVRGPVTLKADEIYSIHIEAPASEGFTLSWDQPAGIPMVIPPTVLYQPTETVGAPCSSV
jgi:hypothetical protein